jgi:hypothetical protein
VEKNQEGHGTSIGNILYDQAKLMRILIMDTEYLSDQPITGYGDAFNQFNSI